MKRKSAPVEFKTGAEADLEEGEFVVYPSTFTREPDSYGDVIAPGAFLRGIKERAEKGIPLPGLFGHRMDDPDFYVASATAEEEDDHGWRLTGKFDMDSPKGPQVYRLVKNGLLREMSFAFQVRDSAQVTLDDGRKAHEIRDIDVFEFSFVPIGANRDTSIEAVKSVEDPSEQPLTEAELKKVRLMLEERSQKSLAGTPPVETPEEGEAAGKSPTDEDLLRIRTMIEAL